MNIAKTKEGLVEITFPHTYEAEDGKDVTEDITVWVKRGSFTIAIQNQFANAGTNLRAITGAIAEMVEKWSIDWDGEEWLPNEENLAQTSDIFLADLVEAITGRMMGKQLKPSRSGSARAAR